MVISVSKREGYKMHLIPVRDRANIPVVCDMVHKQSDGTGVWVYYCDGKWHKGFPTIIMPGLVEMFRRGRDITPESLGYRPHWIVFEDIVTGEFSFGNKPSFSRGDEYSRAEASKMPVIDLKWLEAL